MGIRVGLYNKMTYIKYIIIKDIYKIYHNKRCVIPHHNKKNVELSTFLSIKENIIVKIKI